MGYTTDFTGQLLFAGEPSATILRELNKYLGGDMRKFDPDYAQEHDANYIDLQLTDDFRGVEWSGAEKSYGMVAVVNWLIAKIQEIDKNFYLVGEINAQGEEFEDRWILRIVKGVAVKIKHPPEGEIITCPDCGHRFLLGE